MVTKLKPKEQGKTKADLLRVMGRLGACDEAVASVTARPQELAEDIGAVSERVHWLSWLLDRRLTRKGRELLRRRLGDAAPQWNGCWCEDCMGSCGAQLRAVIDDCWRAWCRS